MATNTKTSYRESPFGVAVHPWISKADTKFAKSDDDALFHLGLLVGGAEAQKLKEFVDAESEAFFSEYIQRQQDAGKLTKGEAKKWSVYVPYVELEDEEGNKTGDIRFDFKQNETIKLKDGSTKKVSIGVYDSEGNDVTKPVYNGSTLRVMYKPRGIPMVSLKQAGVRLDFSAVQVRKLMSGGGGPRFGKVEGGYVERDEQPEADTGEDY